MQLQLRKAASLGILLVIFTTLSGCIFVPGLRVSASGDHSRASTPYRVIEVTPQLIAQQKMAATAQNATWSGLQAAEPATSSAERRGGKGGVGSCEFRWSPTQKKK